MGEPSEVELGRFEAQLRARRPGEGRPWVRAAALGAGLAVLAWKAPGWLDDRAWDAAAACRAQHLAEARLAGDACSLSPIAHIARAFPWTRGAARWRRRDAARFAAEQDLAVATTYRPSRGARAEATLRFASVQRDVGVGPDPGSPDPVAVEREVTRRLFQAGALEEVASRDPVTGPEVLAARLALGDVEGARAAARVASEDPRHGRTEARRRGAVLALLGERAPAIEALVASDRGWEGQSRDARWGLLLLAARADEAGFAPASGLDDDELARALLVDPAWASGRRALVAFGALDGAGVPGADRLRLVAEVAASDAAPLDLVGRALSRVVRDAVGLPRPSERAIALDGALGGDVWLSQIAVPDAAVFRAASARLLALAAQLPSGAPAAPDGEGRDLAADRDLDPGVLAPGPLRHAAWALRLEGAAHALALGDARGAASDARAAAGLAPPEIAWLSAAPLLRAGALDEVIAMTTAALADPATRAPADRGWLHVARARARAAQRDLEGARADLEAASSLEGSAQRDARMLSWLLARSGEDAAAPGPIEGGGELVEVASIEPEARRAAREKVSQRGALTLAGLALGALAASPGDDVEVWLDRLHRAPEHDLRAYLRARAELARWRGDMEAAGRHEARAAALDALVTDGRSAMLARLAGL